MNNYRALLTGIANRLETASSSDELRTRACAAVMVIRLALEQPGPSDEQLLALMPQQMCDDLAAASRALAQQAGTSAGVFRTSLNRHVLDYARIILSHGSANE